jgi:epoxyqueuosine reductase
MARENVMTLKAEFVSFVRETLGIPLVGVAPPDDLLPDDRERISFVLKTFSEGTPLAAGADSVLQPGDFLPGAQSVIVTGTPGYLGKVRSFEECREELLGKAEPSHVNMKLLHHTAEQNAKICEFLNEKGFQCTPVVGIQFPIKLIASKCGVGFYGKNSIIQHPEYGSWIGLSAFITDAELSPDAPLTEDCGKCELCLKACPTGALFAPYRCDVTRCLDFHLGHNKKNIPVAIREKSGNLLGEGCTVCRDVCPKNQKLEPITGFNSPENLLYPSLLKILDITDDEWENGFAMTLMGFFLLDKRYLKRNAAIGLGNFKDERALEALGHLLETGEDEVRGYAAWAIGNIGGMEATRILESSLVREKDGLIKQEIESALAAARCPQR